MNKGFNVFTTAQTAYIKIEPKKHHTNIIASINFLSDIITINYNDNELVMMLIENKERCPVRQITGYQNNEIFMRETSTENTLIADCSTQSFNISEYIEIVIDLNPLRNKSKKRIKKRN